MKQIQNKEVLINIRLRSDIREEFRLAAELRGATMSGLLHQFIVRIIREEKERDPKAFIKLESTNLSEAESTSEQHFDPARFPAQDALYKQFLNETKLNETETTSKKADDLDATLSKEPAHENIINSNDKTRGQRGGKGGRR
ncbi:MAG: hypothetical protein WBP93_15900 [Pyrinomonadaceae bacterium]